MFDKPSFINIIRRVMFHYSLIRGINFDRRNEFASGDCLARGTLTKTIITVERLGISFRLYNRLGRVHHAWRNFLSKSWSAWYGNRNVHRRSRFDNNRN